MGKLDRIQYIKDQCFSKPPAISSFAQDLFGRTIVIIGANVGLGYETAKHFASLKPARIILGYRNKEKAETAAKEIQEFAPSGTVVKPWVVDLTDFKTVSDFADRYGEEGNGQLDILIMNAGVNVAGKYSKDESRWEKSIKVNHLST